MGGLARPGECVSRRIGSVTSRCEVPFSQSSGVNRLSVLRCAVLQVPPQVLRGSQPAAAGAATEGVESADHLKWSAAAVKTAVLPHVKPLTYPRGGRVSANCSCGTSSGQLQQLHAFPSLLQQQRRQQQHLCSQHIPAPLFARTHSSQVGLAPAGSPAWCTCTLALSLKRAASLHPSIGPCSPSKRAIFLVFSRVRYSVPLFTPPCLREHLPPAGPHAAPCPADRPLPSLPNPTLHTARPLTPHCLPPPPPLPLPSHSLPGMQQPQAGASRQKLPVRSAVRRRPCCEKAASHRLSDGHAHVQGQGRLCSHGMVSKVKVKVKMT